MSKRSSMRWVALATTVGLCIGLVGCAPAPTATPVPPPTLAAQPTVKVGQDAVLGAFLTDAAGMSLYLYTKDSPNTTTCYGTCAQNWPPLVVKDAPIAGSGVTASLLGTVVRTDGARQVTYNGWPLYYYVKDTKAGDVTGQGVGTIWYVISPQGEKITKTK